MLYNSQYKSGKFTKFTISKLNIDLFSFYLEYLRNENLNFTLSYSIFVKILQNLKFLKLNLKKNINKKLYFLLLDY